MHRKMSRPSLSCARMNTPVAEQEAQIEKKPFDAEVYDVMGGSSRWEIKVHDHGLVALLDVMPRFAPVGKTADFAIVQAARVSYGTGQSRSTRIGGESAT